eukprot:268118_1
MGKARNQTCATECTINLHKRLHGVQFKRRGKRAVKEVRKFVSKLMLTSDVRVDPELNKYLWSKGIRNIPGRVRVKITKKRNDDEDSAEKFYSHVTVVHVDSFKGLTNEMVDADEE